MNHLASIFEVSKDLNECAIAAQKSWNQFASITTPSPKDVNSFQPIYSAILTCSNYFAQYTPTPNQAAQYDTFLINLLRLIHYAESPLIPFQLSPKHFPILTQLITIASNETLIHHFLEPLVNYLNSPYLHSLAFNRLISLGTEQAKHHSNAILATLCQPDNLKTLTISQLFELRNALLSLIPHAMLFVSPPHPIVQLLTAVDDYLKSIEENQ